MRYLSICSGIEAASVAWEGLGWAAAGYAEIDPFASAVLAERFGSNLPGEALSRNAPPNFGDFTAIPLDTLGTVDLLVGGTPCQAFSFAGKRLSLEDARGNLTLAFAVLAHELAGSHGLRNALWENVPGVLSTPDNAFGCFLGALVGADAPLDLPAGIGRWPDAGLVAGPRARAAWRVLDAQYFGLAQRRERVFVVVDLGNGADPAAVLFEPQGLQGNSPPRREAGQKPAPTVAGGARSRGGYSTDDVPLTALEFGGNNTAGPIDVSTALNAHGGPMGRMDFESETFVAEVASTLDTSYGRLQGASGQDLNHGHSHLVAFDTTQITSKTNRSNPKAGDPCHPLAAGAHAPAIAFDARQSDVLIYGDMTGPLDTDGHTIGVAAAAYRTSGNNGAWSTGDKVDALTTGTDRTSHLLTQGWAVRRLTPAECARLQGFPDHHSRIAWRGKPAELCPDGPQYKTYGNSMAVAVMRWLGERLNAQLPETCR